MNHAPELVASCEDDAWFLHGGGLFCLLWLRPRFKVWIKLTPPLVALASALFFMNLCFTVVKAYSVVHVCFCLMFALMQRTRAIKAAIHKLFFKEQLSLPVLLLASGVRKAEPHSFFNGSSRT